MADDSETYKYTVSSQNGRPQVGIGPGLCQAIGLEPGDVVEFTILDNGKVVLDLPPCKHEVIRRGPDMYYCDQCGANMDVLGVVN